MPGQLLTALSLQDALGNDVDLMRDPSLRITKASGLFGIASREVVIPRAGRSGSRVLTRYREDSSIVLNGILVGDTADNTFQLYDTIAGVFADAIDSSRLLKWTAGKMLRLQQNVRLVSLEPPFEVGPDVIRYQVAFRASDPNVYSQTLNYGLSLPFGSGGGGGLLFPVTFPFRFNRPTSTVAQFTNAGFIPTPPTFVLHGYLVDPIIQLSSTKALVLKGTLAPSDQLKITVSDRTILLNDTFNRRYMLVTSQSSWFDLPKGTGTVTLFSTYFDANARLEIYWRDARA